MQELEKVALNVSYQLIKEMEATKKLKKILINVKTIW